MSSNVKAHLLTLAANFFFGASVVAVKHITPALMPPLSINVIRVSVALILFWMMAFFTKNNLGITIKKQDVKLFIICGLTGVAINQVLFIKGTALTSSIHTSLLSLITPIVITIIAAFMLNEKITTNKIIGLFLGITGSAILILIKAKNDDESSVWGDVLIILNAISYAFYLVLVKPLMINYKPMHVIRWVFTIGALFIIPIGYKDFLQTNWSGFLWHHWLALGFIVIGATFLSYMFIVYGISKLGSSVTGTYIYTQPVFATITSMILFEEKLTFIKIASALLIFAGVFFVNRRKKES